MNIAKNQTVLGMLIAAALLLSAIAFTVVMPRSLHAASPQQNACEGTGGEWKPATETVPAHCVSDATQAGTVTVESALKTVVNVLLFVIGAVSVIMIVIGGIKYTTSNGDSSAVTSAKNTILYSVVGLVIALMAYAIINFVLEQF
jgi:hypothetical protein